MTTSKHSFLSHFLIGFDGIDLPANVAQMLSEGLAGVVLFKRNIDSAAQVRALTDAIRVAGGEDRIIAVDQEGGRVQRLKDIGTKIPAAARLAELGGKAVEAAGTVMARELAALGFNLDFSPVMDVMVETGDNIIGDRAFSTDPFVCAGMGAKMMSALHAGGIMACPKHFPGHGAANADSHKFLPVVDADYRTMTTRELVPFRSAVRSGARMVMTAHCVYERLDPTLPASLSYPILQGLLRKNAGFEGVIVSDDLEMKAIADRFTIKGTLELGMKAGIDLFMYCFHPDFAVEGANILSGMYSDDRAMLRLNDSHNRLEAVHEWILANAKKRDKYMSMDFGELVSTNKKTLEKHGITND